MPISFRKDQYNNYYFQWGNQKKYYCDKNDPKSIKKAYTKAVKQMKAVYSNGYHSK